MVIKCLKLNYQFVIELYESRPNVTVDANTLTLKSGNTIILREVLKILLK